MEVPSVYDFERLEEKIAELEHRVSLLAAITKIPDEIWVIGIKSWSTDRELYYFSSEAKAKKYLDECKTDGTGIKGLPYYKHYNLKIWSKNISGWYRIDPQVPEE